VDYIFTSTLLTSVDSAILSDGNFSSLGGVVTEGFVLPVDPVHLFDRTGYACMDEEDFPPNSVDTENALSFYDSSCRAGENNFCHVTLPAPKESCVAALKNKVGRVGTEMKFTRMPWNSVLAQNVRTGSTNSAGADLEVQLNGLKNNRIIYRYISPNSCAIAEGCVGGSGWRRLLQFDGSVANRGAYPAHLGDVSDGSLLVQHNMFELSACHGHRHFSHYGNFTFGTGTQMGSKRAFCMESTQRYSNNESTPLTHPYSCDYQGIEAGWGDDYIAGIECQWIDITNVNTSIGPVSGDLAFKSNPDQFICEGKPVLDSAGNFTFVPTSFVTEDGNPVDRINCNFVSNWDVNNLKTLSVTVPKAGGYITSACPQGRDGEVRNCGFKALGNLRSCTPGQSFNLNCTTDAGGQPQILRVCDSSKVMGIGIPCTYRDSFKNVVLEPGKTESISGKCPGAKDAREPGGQVSLFSAPVHVSDTASKISCK
jgi:hypothetical protein